MSRGHGSHQLNLRAGELVEVRSLEEILATLDERGRLEAMPFMPEMREHCGKRFRVYKSAHKTCDTIEYQGARKLERTVHLEGTRCSGAFHDGCQASCLFFWKEAWLKRVNPQAGTRPQPPQSAAAPSRCDEQALMRATREPAAPGQPEAEIVYRCQATELNRASEVLEPTELRQYVKDVRSGNVSIGRIVSALAFWIFSKTLRIGAYRLQIRLYDAYQRWRGGIPYPFKYGSCTKTPNQSLNLQPGEHVRVKSQQEILTTVNARNRNRGLSFDEEMVGFCGGTYRVLARVQKIINERTGKMMKFGNDCIILDGVTCQSRFKDKRLFCPRAIYPYWREIWLQRVSEAGGAGAPRQSEPNP
jgi:hypothetical protein